MRVILQVTIILSFLVILSNPQLLINVKNQGGDIMHENISANVSDDTVMLEFLRSDGIFISQLVDFSNEVEVLKIIIPGEEELGQTGFQVLCFLKHVAHADFIPPDAMAKLRQKNPGTVRTAEEDRGWNEVVMTAWAGGAIRLLSPVAARHCSAARDHTYLRTADFSQWASRPGLEQSWLTAAVTPFPSSALSENEVEPKAQVTGTCVGERDLTKECICHFEVCINWYPCGLKYCKGKPQNEGAAHGLSYRCGIKTCRRCQKLHYYARRKAHCLWDE